MQRRCPCCQHPGIPLKHILLHSRRRPFVCRHCRGAVRITHSTAFELLQQLLLIPVYLAALAMAALTALSGHLLQGLGIFMAGNLLIGAALLLEACLAPIEPIPPSA
ncbi:hypothetical protein [Vandammella animalimorsus]|uniref:hypothetical protein n=1 Tax=Vandammella animalimorsus TaxID=2029117 RepID=UPI001177C73F|nr:hypothetical protein [Vandammella animalimorsus]